VGKLVTHGIEQGKNEKFVVINRPHGCDVVMQFPNVGDGLAEGSAMDEAYVEKLFDKENLCEWAEVLMVVLKGRKSGHGWL